VWHQLGTTDLYSTGFKIFGNFVEIMGSFEQGVLLPPVCEHYSRGVARAVPGHGNIPVSTSFAERRVRVTGPDTLRGWPPRLSANHSRA
jgi:hypothetical protein